MIEVKLQKKGASSFETEGVELSFCCERQDCPLENSSTASALRLLNIVKGEALERKLLLKISKQMELSQRYAEEIGAAVTQKCIQEEIETIIIDYDQLEPLKLSLLTGCLLSGWQFQGYRSSFSPSFPKTIILQSEDPSRVEKELSDVLSTCEGVFYARELTSLAPNRAPPLVYAQELKKLRFLGVEVEILEEEEIRKLGMEAFLSVGQGSHSPSCMVILSWKGDKKEQKPIAFVGKGICFDSGGICLKEKKFLYEMKWDKAAAGVIAGVFKAAALQQLPVHLVAVLGLSENMPDGKSLKPGDVIGSFSGQTIEIVDTDAEGRLILADCLSYVQKRFDPISLIDLGTLTIETMASLGTAFAGLYSNCKHLQNELLAAGEATCEYLWPLPMGPSFAKQIESPIADMKNSGIDLCGENGAAAEFLKRFVKDIPWAHLDISGVSWSLEDRLLSRKGVTGFGVRLLLHWLKIQMHKTNP